MPWHQTPSRKKKAVVFTNVTTNAYQDQLHAGFSKVCEIFKVCGIESLKYVREFYTPVCYCGDISKHQTWRWTKRTVIGCLTCRSNALMGGPWPIKPAIYSRTSAVSLKVWLRETSANIDTFTVGRSGAYSLQIKHNPLRLQMLEVNDNCYVHYYVQQQNTSIA